MKPAEFAEVVIIPTVRTTYPKHLGTIDLSFLDPQFRTAPDA